MGASQLGLHAAFVLDALGDLAVEGLGVLGAALDDGVIPLELLKQGLIGALGAAQIERAGGFCGYAHGFVAVLAEQRFVPGAIDGGKTFDVQAHSAESVCWWWPVKFSCALDQLLQACGELATSEPTQDLGPAVVLVS
ncbi:hypothetical protein D3C80_1269320 [compost metagenome]